MPAKRNNSTVTKKTIDPSIAKQRRETIEKRIFRLENKLNKDRALLLRYAETNDTNQAEEAVHSLESSAQEP